MTRILAIALTLGLATILVTQSSSDAEAAKRGKKEKSLQVKASEPRKGEAYNVEMGITNQGFPNERNRHGPRLKRR